MLLEHPTKKTWLYSARFLQVQHSICYARWPGRGPTGKCWTRTLAPSFAFFGCQPPIVA